MYKGVKILTHNSLCVNILSHNKDTVQTILAWFYNFQIREAGLKTTIGRQSQTILKVSRNSTKQRDNLKNYLGPFHSSLNGSIQTCFPEGVIVLEQHNWCQ